MIEGISLENGIGSIGSLGGEDKKAFSVGKSFKNVLVKNLEDTNSALNNADSLSQDFALGKETDIHKVMMAMERASVAMQYTIQIRNKLMDGFKEVMSTQV